MVVVEWSGQEGSGQRGEDVVVADAVLASGLPDDHEAAAHWASA